MNEAAAAGRPSVMQRLLERVQDEVRMRGRGSRQPTIRRG